MNPRSLCFLTIDSPIGKLTLVASEKGLSGVYMEASEIPEATPGTSSFLTETQRQLNDYFAGKLRSFELPLDLQGTPFQMKVWHSLLDIPYGETISYGEQARRIDNPKAVRAVGLANGRNPVSIIIPCHRVIGKNGSLTGYGGGLDRKRFLLNLEANLSPSSEI